MRAKNRSDKQEALDEIICDLKLIIDRDEITGKEIEELLSEVKSEEVKKYLKSLKGGSKPEEALKDAFFAGANSVLVKYLFGWINPETNVESGFVDYLTDSRGDSKGIAIEIKPLFEARFERGKSGRVLEKITQRELRWDKYKDQIRKYLGRRGEFVIFTNLKEWYFFSKNYSLENCDYFFNTDLEAFIEEYSQIEDLHEYLDRKEQEAIKEVLDKKFFASLRSWINELSEVAFVPGISEREKNELIINLINKFIFIQTLDDFWVIENKWIQNHWDSVERKWHAKGKLKVLTEFFNEEVNKWFYEFYDTELFRGNILDYVERDDRNIDLFYRKLKLILGIDFGATAIGWVRGIMQFNFRRINEDIFGKAYESYLAELRKEQGIFYTPSYITEYIVENTVGKIFDDILGEIESAFSAENFEEAKKLVGKFIAVKVLDPACGSGSFLIKALRLIWRKYARLREIFGDRERVYLKNGISSDELGELKEIKQILGAGNNRDRELISKVIVRHIHGNDLDRRALEVAKVNIWLEAIKLAPKDFRFDLLGATNHILPDLEMNLACGDSLVGLPEDLTIEVLKGHKEKIVKLWELRKKYLEDTSRAELVDSIESIKNELRGVLYREFRRYLEDNDLPLEILEETKALHWALEFWYVFFDENGVALPEEERGFDAVVGNPPYVTLALGKGQKFVSNEILAYFNKKFRKSSEYKGNTYTLFIEKGLCLLKNNSRLGFIIPNTLLTNYYFKKIREYILNTCKIINIANISDRVFKDAEIGGNTILTLEIEKDENLRDKNKIEILKVEDVEKFSKNLYNIEIIAQELLTRIPDKRFLLEKADLTLITKLRKDCMKLGDVAITYQGIITGDNKKFLSNKKETEKHKKIIRGKDIERYSLNFGGIYVYFDKNQLWSNTDEGIFLVNEKIISRQTSDHLVATYDNEQYFSLDSTHVIIPHKIDIKYFLALFNSRLLNYYYQKSVPESGRTFAQVKTVSLKQLPIKLTSSDKQKPIIELVDRIIILKKSYHALLKTWNKWSTKLKNDELSLHQILVNDANLMRAGEFEDTWTSEVSFYPDGEHENLSKGYNKFRAVGDTDKPILKVYGLDEHNKEELVYEMEFKNRDLMLHVFLAIKQALESKRKIKTPAHLLAKTIVPLIQPDSVMNTPNIMRKVREEFENMVESERNEKIEPDIVRIENEIEEVDANIDALVFRLYGLDEDEVRLVLESLNDVNSYQRKILEEFVRITE